jgi:hypothetical protein
LANSRNLLPKVVELSQRGELTKIVGLLAIRLGLQPILLGAVVYGYPSFSGLERATFYVRGEHRDF